jgi:hypothetical protein
LRFMPLGLQPCSRISVAIELTQSLDSAAQKLAINI